MLAVASATNSSVVITSGGANSTVAVSTAERAASMSTPSAAPITTIVSIDCTACRSHVGFGTTRSWIVVDGS